MSVARLGAWDWYIPTNKVVYDKRWYEMLGYEHLELDFSTPIFEKLLHPDDVASTLVTLEAHLKSKADSYDIEFRMLHKAGHAIWVNSIGKVMERDADGTPIRMIGMHMDISERKAAELAVEARDDVVKRIAQLAKVGGWSLDLSRNELYWKDRKSTRLNSSHGKLSRMPSSA